TIFCCPAAIVGIVCSRTIGLPDPLIVTVTWTSDSLLTPPFWTVTSNDSFWLTVMLVVPPLLRDCPPGRATVPTSDVPWRPGATGPLPRPLLRPSRCDATTVGRTH